jgi:hypothetical protein
VITPALMMDMDDIILNPISFGGVKRWMVIWLTLVIIGVVSSFP